MHLVLEQGYWETCDRAGAHAVVYKQLWRISCGRGIISNNALADKDATVHRSIVCHSWKRPCKNWHVFEI